MNGSFESLLGPIVDQLGSGRNLIVIAPPGAGKTTLAPPALAEAVSGRVLVLEPRRIAARAAAQRVAHLRGEPLGSTVGYQVRFESAAGPRTRLVYMTEGLLVRRLLDDPSLAGVSAVVLDEFHERHLETDLALALLRRLQRAGRPDLRLLVMSATLDTTPVAAYLAPCPVIEFAGRSFGLDIAYTPHSARPLEEQVAEAVERLVAAGVDGDILAFLPGAAEIRRAGRSAADLAACVGLDLCQMHGDLSLEEQARVLEPSERRRLILSTNVAESSLTIPGVTAVIDSGLARMVSYSPWTGLPSLAVKRIGQASARQRAGRAGRTGPGRVIRLYSEDDFARRLERDPPEILRADLSEATLLLRCLGLKGWTDLELLDHPGTAQIAAAAELLDRLGAGGELGRRMARLPLHPRLSRLVVEAEEGGAGDDGCAVAALVAAGARLPAETHQAGPSDLLWLLDSEWSFEVKRLYDQIRRTVRPKRGAARGDSALLKAVLAAFPDRVARRRQGDEFLLAAGGAARLAPASVVREARFLVAVDVEDRPDRGLPLVRLASAIEPEWLLDQFPDRVVERVSLEWNRNAERVEQVSALCFDALAIEESRGGAANPAAAAEQLAGRALEAGLERFADVSDLVARARFAGFPLGPAELREALVSLCEGRRSFAELEAAARGGGLARALERRLPPGLLDGRAPEFVRLPTGRRVRVHYEESQPPWIASRLQDFFGLRESPRVGEPPVSVVVKLLAPNQRPVQTTTDLAGFWQRLYPQVRRELMRRYPKHAWPEDPNRK